MEMMAGLGVYGSFSNFPVWQGERRASCRMKFEVERASSSCPFESPHLERASWYRASTASLSETLAAAPPSSRTPRFQLLPSTLAASSALSVCLSLIASLPPSSLPILLPSPSAPPPSRFIFLSNTHPQFLPPSAKREPFSSASPSRTFSFRGSGLAVTCTLPSSYSRLLTAVYSTVDRFAAHCSSSQPRCGRLLHRRHLLHARPGASIVCNRNITRFTIRPARYTAPTASQVPHHRSTHARVASAALDTLLRLSRLSTALTRIRSGPSRPAASLPSLLCAPLMRL